MIEPWGTDSIPPSIKLISPSDYSFIDIGTEINLSISDLNLDEVTYSINNQGTMVLPSPYNIDTGDWTDGDYEIEVRAKDSSDNVKAVIYHFFIDSIPPAMTLKSPSNNSMINADTIIGLIISDENIEEVRCSINGGVTISLYSPYVIDPSGWSEGENIVTVIAKDKADNLNERWYMFTLDKTPPKIILNSPENGSFLHDLTIDFDVIDENLDSVSYFKNQEDGIIFQEPYDLSISDWDDGEYKIVIKADDIAENSNEQWFIFNKDSISPSISSIYPSDNSIDIDINERIIINFSEPMDLQSVESAITISPYTDYSCAWSNDNSTLTIIFSDDLEYQTLYEISIRTNGQDLASNNLEGETEFEFITKDKQKNGIGEFQIFPFILVILIVIGIIGLIVLLLIKRQKPALKSKYAWSQLQEQTKEVMCPKCGFYFMVAITGGPIHVSCPNCGTSGTMR